MTALNRHFPDINFTDVMVDGRPHSNDGIEDLKQFICDHANTMTYAVGSHRNLMIGRKVSAILLSAFFDKFLAKNVTF